MEGFFSDAPLLEEAVTGLKLLQPLDEAHLKKIVHAAGEVIIGRVSGPEAADIIAKVQVTRCSLHI